jgi:RNA polymerase sigma factor (sigma-70 family)
MTGDSRIGIEDLLAHADWIRGLARHLAHGEGDDVAQDAWLIAERSPPDSSRPARPWFAQVLRNLVRVRRRNDTRRVRREEDYVQTLPDKGPAVDELYERLELHRFLAEQVMALEEPLRTFVILRYFEGLDSFRIGRLTGTPSGTVRWRLKIAIDRLRSTLDARHGGERKAWVVILMPGAVERNARRALTEAMLMANSKMTTISIASLVVLVLLVLSGGGALLWMQGRVFSASRRSTTAIDNHVRSTDGGRSKTFALKHVPGPFLAIAPTDLGECRAAVARTHEELAEREGEARSVVPRVAFEAGTPNNGLREEVSPQVDRLLAGADESKVPIHHLECRAWACKLTVIIAYEDTGAVQPWLQALGSWLPRLKGLQSLAMPRPSPLGVALQWAGTRTKADLLAHRKIEETQFFFGSPTAAAETEATMETPAVASATPEECRSELGSVRERLRRLDADWPVCVHPRPSSRRARKHRN